jgi:Caspase domain
MKNLILLILTLVWANSFAQTQKPELFILSVGVSKYQNTNSSVRNLQFAHKDAIDLAEAFKKQTGLFDVRRVSVLTDEKATRKNVREEFISFKKDISPNDLFIFIFSGHGLKESLVTHDFDMNDRRTTSLGKEELTELISDLNCGYLVILDACHSGSFAKGIEIDGKSPTDIDFNKEENIANENLIRALNASNKPNVIISSSTDRELSDEGDENGYFTKAILDAVEGKPVKNNKTGKIYTPDNDKDGFIYSNELDDYLKETINLITQNKPIQQNVTSKPTAGYKFPIFKLTDTDDDGTADLYDECNGIKGSAKGCPDGDEDGVADKNDKCPNEKGIISFEGCPNKAAIPLPQPSKGSAFAKSLVFPGWGEKEFKPKSKKIWMGVLSYASLAGGFLMQSKSNQYLSQYQKAIKQSEIDGYRTNILKFNNYSTALWGLSATIWAIDLISIASKKSNKIKPASSGVGLSYSF